MHSPITLGMGLGARDRRISRACRLPVLLQVQVGYNLNACVVCDLHGPSLLILGCGKLVYYIQGTSQKLNDKKLLSWFWKNQDSNYKISFQDTYQKATYPNSEEQKNKRRQPHHPICSERHYQPGVGL